MATLILAGAGLLVVVALWIVAQRRQAGARAAGPGASASSGRTTAGGAAGDLRVTLDFGVVSSNTLARDDRGEMLIVTATNNSAAPERVVAVGLLLEGLGRTLPWLEPGSDRPVPFVLRPQEQNRFWSSVRDLGEAMVSGGVFNPVRVRGFVQTVGGHTSHSEWRDCDPKVWAGRAGRI